jgi:hypothetical protein
VLFEVHRHIDFEVIDPAGVEPRLRSDAGRPNQRYDARQTGQEYDERRK